MNVSIVLLLAPFYFPAPWSGLCRTGHLKSEHTDRAEPGLSPRDFTTHEVGHLRELHPLGTPPVKEPTTSLNRDFLFNSFLSLYRPGPSLGCLLRRGPALSDHCARRFAARGTANSALPWPPDLDTPVLPSYWLQE